MIERGLRELGYRAARTLYFTEHHESHAASAFFPSPFETAAVLTFDGVGEWATTQRRRRARATASSSQRQLRFPHSLGPALLGVHLLLRLQGQLRRVQADGPGALRRAALRRRASSTS